MAVQLGPAAKTWAVADGTASAILKLIDLISGLRAEERDEVLGLDVTQHGEVAYHST